MISFSRLVTLRMDTFLSLNYSVTSRATLIYSITLLKALGSSRRELQHAKSKVLSPKKEQMPFAATWMQLEIIMLSEVSQKEKDKYHMISLTCRL